MKLSSLLRFLEEIGPVEVGVEARSWVGREGGKVRL